MRRETALMLVGLLATAPLAVLAAPAAPGQAAPPALAGGDPLVVVAHIDVGINPYNRDFRWDDPRAYEHPCTYLPKYPCDATRLDLTLDAADWNTAFNADLPKWQAIEGGKLYWIPGTKVVGAISFGQDGAHRILDDHGHGTMTASRSMGNTHSLCDSCLLVSIEGLGTTGVRYAADSGFVDVQTNSWGSLLPGGPLFFSGIARAQREAAAKHVVLFASGNGIEFQGFVSCDTYTLATGGPGVILVGAHDNGLHTAWHCRPAHVIADGYGGWTATRDSIDIVRPDPVSCCTSTSSPYAAGGAAAIVQEARRIVGDAVPGPKAGGIVAQGTPGLVAQGPLVDGVLTLDEFKQVFFHTATLRPVEGPDDGLTNWLGTPVESVQAIALDPQRAVPLVTNPGQNPYCPGCFTTPLPWSALPEELGAVWEREGYGGIDVRSVALAKQVLRGEVPMPERPVEDALYALDQDLRRLYFFQQLPQV